ncbi:unnamed protein product [Orchesella dallaii]|uniref:G-protein coupled receptors family 1 profile domain-containing protein n=1 Tax=Orchesella dallaii TaxID=48710 RepID=A0ABP1QEV6_9HEXA
MLLDEGDLRTSEPKLGKFYTETTQLERVVVASTKESLIESLFGESNSQAQEKEIFSSSNENIFNEMETTFNYSTAAPNFEAGNVSDYIFTDNGNGFPWSSSTQDPILIGGGSVNADNSDGETLSLPVDFTQISPLNKDCIIVYSVLFVFAAVGNLMVLSSVTRHDRLGKSRTPLLIMNLCMADLIVTFFLMPTEVFWRLTIAWKGGDVLCKLSQFVRAFGLYLSSNVVICISIDRYFAIVYPLKLAGAVKRVKWTLIGAWIVSAIFAGPQMFVYHVASHPVYPEFRQCVTKAFLKESPYNELIYNVSSVAALYFIPLIVIIYTYTMILWKIHQKSREQRVANSQQQTSQPDRTNFPNHLNTPQSDVIAYYRKGSSSNLSRSSSKTTRLMLRSSANQTATLTRARSRTLRLTLLILLTFIVCWTPYVVMTLWYMLDRNGASQVDERLQEALFIMAVTNSVINPLIYGTVGRRQHCDKRFNSLFRSSSWTCRIFKFFCCCCLCSVCCTDRDRDRIIMMNRVNVNSRAGLGGNEKSRRSRDLSPRSQVVTLRTMRSNSDIVLRFIRSIGSSRRERQEDTMDKSECIECGITSQYIVPEGGSGVSQNVSSTPV